MNSVKQSDITFNLFLFSPIGKPLSPSSYYLGRHFLEDILFYVANQNLLFQRFSSQACYQHSWNIIAVYLFNLTLSTVSMINALQEVEKIRRKLLQNVLFYLQKTMCLCQQLTDFHLMSWLRVWKIFCFPFLCCSYFWLFHCKGALTHRSSHQRSSLKDSVLKNFAKFKGKHLYQNLFFTKVAGLQVTASEPISCYWSLFIPPGKIRKPLVF